ncbi:MAG: histidine kinase [Cyclobacteriaceae bacterium]|nr:histidine kinase [Cyclobacteriaceae bacterium]
MKQKINLTKRQTYWLCQVLGWSTIVVVETINYTFVLTDGFQWVYVSSFGRQALYGLLVSHFYKVLFIKPSTFQQPLRRLWMKGLLDTFNISLIITCIILSPSLFTGFRIEQSQVSTAILEIAGRIMNQGRYIIVWIIIYYMYKILERNREITAEKLQMDNLLTTTELELLKTQLNPHFLFNALNSIKALVLIDGDKARDAIVKLSELLYFSLSYEKMPLITMKEEIYKVEKYLELEKIRFGQRLSFQFDINATVMDMQVPPALILTLAENAIKHGIAQLPDGGKIKVISKLEDTHLRIEVLNTGQLKADNLKGIGLKNVRSRLKNLFGTQAQLNLMNYSHEEVLVSVIYPIQLHYT